MITFTFAVDGAGFEEDNFNIAYYNLDEEPEITNDDPGSIPLELSSLNSWYNDQNGGGYNVILEFVLSAEIFTDTSDFGWTAEIQYAGSGDISTGWMDGYPGNVSVTVVNASLISFSNDNASWQPPIAVGDTIRLAIQIQNTPFDLNDFTLSFTQ